MIKERDVDIEINGKPIICLCEFDKGGMLVGVYKYDDEETFYLEDGKNLINTLPEATIEKIYEDIEVNME